MQQTSLAITSHQLGVYIAFCHLFSSAVAWGAPLGDHLTLTPAEQLHPEIMLLHTTAGHIMTC